MKELILVVKLLLISSLLLSCKQRQTLDLQLYGIKGSLICEPPDSISYNDLIVVKEIGLHWRDFEIMILQLLDERHEIDSLCLTQKSKIESLAGFKQFIQNESRGFVYQVKKEDDINRYGFRYCNDRILIKEHNGPYFHKRLAKRGLRIAHTFSFLED